MRIEGASQFRFDIQTTALAAMGMPVDVRVRGSTGFQKSRGSTPDRRRHRGSTAQEHVIQRFGLDHPHET
jgi:hypothetical protein